MIRCSYMTYHAILKETLFFGVYRIIMNSWSLARLYPVPGVPCCICWYQSINVLVSRWRHQFASGCTSTMPRVVPGTRDFMCRLMSTCGIHLCMVGFYVHGKLVWSSCGICRVATGSGDCSPHSWERYGEGSEPAAAGRIQFSGQTSTLQDLVG